MTRFASLRGGTTKQIEDSTKLIQIIASGLDCFVPRSDAKREKSKSRPILIPCVWRRAGGWDGVGFFSQRIEPILSNKLGKFLLLPP